MTDGGHFAQEKRLMLDRAHARCNATVAELVVTMRACPFTDPAERWAAAVALIDTLDRPRDSPLLLAAAAVDRLSQHDDQEASHDRARRPIF